MYSSSIMYLHGNSVFDQHRSQLSVQLEEDLSLAGLVQVTQRQRLDVEGLPSLQLHLRWETVREEGECEGGRGQKLDYVRKLKLIHRGLAHKSSWSNKKRLQSSVKLKKGELVEWDKHNVSFSSLFLLTLRLGWSVSQHALGRGQRNMHRLMSRASLQLNFVINK